MLLVVLKPIDQRRQVLQAVVSEFHGFDYFLMTLAGKSLGWCRMREVDVVADQDSWLCKFLENLQ